MSLDMTKCNVCNFSFFEVVMEVSLSVKSIIGADCTPTDLSTISTSVTAAMIEIISALYDDPWNS